MRRRLVVPVVIGVVLVGCAVPAGAAGQPAKECPAGFNLGALTFQEMLEHPKVQAALADGVTTVEQVLVVNAFVDNNGNGVLCVQDILQRGAAAPVSGSEYALVFVDDNAAVGQT